MTKWKEKQKEWHEKYDDMFQEFPATESEARRKMIDIYEAHEIFFQYKRRRLWIMTVITIILMFGPPTLAQIMGADREIVGKAAYSIMIFCPVLVAEAQLLIKNGSGIRTCKKKLKQIEKNEVGSYLEEAESFYKRVEERRKKSHEKTSGNRNFPVLCLLFLNRRLGRKHNRTNHNSTRRNLHAEYSSRPRNPVWDNQREYWYY